MADAATPASNDRRVNSSWRWVPLASAGIGWTMVFAVLVYRLTVQPDPSFAPGPSAWPVLGACAVAAIPLGLAPGFICGLVVALAAKRAHAAKLLGSPGVLGLVGARRSRDMARASETR